MNLEQLEARLERAGLDLAGTEARDALNEADRELCIRSEWTRANVAIGPTVADQVAYALPSTVARPLRLWLNGFAYDPSDEDTVRRIEAGELRLRSRGLWWVSHSAAGAESISVYPTPSEAGQEITLLAVVYPASQMTVETDTPNVPADFHRYLLNYVRAISLGESEDAADLEELHLSKFDEGVARLRQRRISRAGRGPTMVRISGVTA